MVEDDIVPQSEVVNDGGPSFIMDYSHNNELRNSQVTQSDANVGASARVSATTNGQFL